MKTLRRLGLFAGLALVSSSLQAADALVPAAPAPASAAPAPAATQALQVQGAYLVLPAAGTDTASVFLTVVNNSTENDKLTHVSVFGTTGSEIDDTKTDKKGGQTVTKVDSVPVPAKKTVAFEPGHLHVAVTGGMAVLTPGMKIPMIVTFEKAGTITSTVEIRAAPASKPAVVKPAK